MCTRYLLPISRGFFYGMNVIKSLFYAVRFNFKKIYESNTEKSLPNNRGILIQSVDFFSFYEFFGWKNY